MKDYLICIYFIIFSYFFIDKNIIFTQAIEVCPLLNSYLEKEIMHKTPAS